MTDFELPVNFNSEPRGCVRGDPPLKHVVPAVPLHPGLERSTHVSLGVVTPTPTPPPATIHLSVINGSNGKTTQLKLKSGDTIGKLKRKYLQLCPEMCDRLNLVCNGKPVQDQQSLAELGVKPGATFVTFQRCTGG
ncbi:hypothetical protein ACEWY4_026523 [Coilia grayii]|uniref:Ubiquitin-like domain-containing protein n=1 Tax=Coilia grayii TaxID=363190 RepID=A0ABD1IQW9_9TELE